MDQKTFTVVLTTGARYSADVLQYVKRVREGGQVGVDVAFRCSGYMQTFPAELLSAVEL